MEYAASRRTGCEWEGQHCKNTVTQRPYVPVPLSLPSLLHQPSPRMLRRQVDVSARRSTDKRYLGPLHILAPLKRSSGTYASHSCSCPIGCQQLTGPLSKCEADHTASRLGPRVSSAKVTGLSAQRGHVVIWSFPPFPSIHNTRVCSTVRFT